MITNINAVTYGPSDHGCGYSYRGGCACRDNIGYGPAEPALELTTNAVRIG